MDDPVRLYSISELTDALNLTKDEDLIQIGNNMWFIHCSPSMMYTFKTMYKRPASGTYGGWKNEYYHFKHYLKLYEESHISIRKYL